ncbi:integrase core domain-containing protein [Streptomyces griseofuscus]|uniref:integrase core domain-containing protein n=1 Tax=Streptomyces griseofuscus TaxID=146922 RepID=UPI003701FC7A
MLFRNGLVRTRQQHPRKYRRWQREAPMHLWQMDLVGGVPLADGRECKMVTGIDDHSRFVVISFRCGRAQCPRGVLGLHRRDAPFFERICRDNGITQRLTKPRSPTTTGKIERFHRTLREEFLDHVAPFETLAAAQEAIDGAARSPW